MLSVILPPAASPSISFYFRFPAESPTLRVQGGRGHANKETVSAATLYPLR
jgi:hypothetical protein